VKFVLAIATILAISLAPVGGFVALMLLWLVLIAVASLARIGSLRPSRAAFIAAPFLLAAAPLVFVRPEEPLGSFAFGPWTFTASGAGLRIFVTVALKSWLSVQIALLLAYTTAFPDLLDGLTRMRLPSILVAIIGLMYRYVAVLTEEASRMLRARASRSAGASGGAIRWRAAVVGNMVGTLFIRAFERSERVYAAMQARGYNGLVRTLPPKPISISQLAVAGGILVAIATFEVFAHAIGPTL
jgi:cobalt/nickel transport system permease protein